MLVSLLVPFQFSMRISLPVPFPFFVLSLALNRKFVKQSTTTRIMFKRIRSSGQCYFSYGFSVTVTVIVIEFMIFQLKL